MRVNNQKLAKELGLLPELDTTVVVIENERYAKGLRCSDVKIPDRRLDGKGLKKK